MDALMHVQMRQLWGPMPMSVMSRAGGGKHALLVKDAKFGLRRKKLERGVSGRRQSIGVGGRAKERAMNVRSRIAEESGIPAPMGQKTKYEDSWFDIAFMKLFQMKMEQITGKKSELEGFEGFVDTSKLVMSGRSPNEQRQAVAKVLSSILPPNAPDTFRKLFPPTKWSAEINAAITVPFFQWLVGPCQLKEVEINGQKQMSGVQITKCRYLEQSGCVGMCVNMCKLPTQDFFTDQFGLPLTMNPNFEDMSCEMIFGQLPPSLEEDSSLNQPCYSGICPTSKDDAPSCPKLITANSL